jgi:hypothetical protein
MKLVLFALLLFSSAVFFVFMRNRRVVAGSGLGTGLDITTKFVRRTASSAAGNGLGATIKYLRRTASVAAGSDLGTTIKYLRQKLPGETAWLTRPSTCVAPQALAWAPRLSDLPSVCAWSPSSLLVFINKIHTSLRFLLLRRLKLIFYINKIETERHHVSTSFPPRRACV